MPEKVAHALKRNDLTQRHQVPQRHNVITSDNSSLRREREIKN